MIDKSKALLCSIFFILFSGTFLVSPKIARAEVACGTSQLTNGSDGNTWDLTYCASSYNRADIASISQIRVTCRSGAGLDVANLFTFYNALGKDCHEEGLDWLNGPAASKTAGVTVDKIGFKDGVYFTCFTVNGLNRNMGKTQFETIGNDGTVLCNQTTDVTPGNYTWTEALDQSQLIQWAEEKTGQEIVNNPIESGTNVFCVDGKSINTALGCIDVSSPQSFITAILRIASGLGGGIALALILYGVFIVTTSAGNPDKLKAGSEIITSAVIGLVFIILSVFIMNLVGINILGIPGLK